MSNTVVKEAHGELIANLKALYESAEYSDFTITCGDETFNVHKAIVCSRSEFFKRAERFSVGSASSEAANNTIDLPEDDPAIVKLLIQYLYETEYEPALTQSVPSQSNIQRAQVSGVKIQGYHYSFPHTCSKDCPPPGHQVCQHHTCGGITCKDHCSNFVCTECCPDYKPPALQEELEGDSSQIILHSKMYEIGDKYGVSGLKNLAQSKFNCACAQWWDTEHFAPAAHHAFSTTPETDKGLRDIVSITISRHMELLKKPEIEAMLNEFNGLAVGILKQRATESG